MESDDSGDIPLNIVQSRIANQSTLPDQPSDDEDDIPLATQVRIFSRLKKKRNPKPPPAIPPSDSDDDIPLASKLRRSQKPSSRSTPSRRKPISKREPETNSKPKKVIKRAPRPKKEEEVPTRKFEKLGQRRETPPENDPTRLFYQSMYHEKITLRKKSFTAESWMLRNGLLNDRDAEHVIARWDLKK